MQCACPNCGTRFVAGQGEEQVCPACMHAFRPVAGGGLPSLMLLEVQGPRGEALGVMDRYEIRERIYAGSFKGRESVRMAGGRWVGIAERPEFAKLLELVGVDVAGLRVANQEIQGWKRDDSAIPEPGTGREIVAAPPRPAPRDRGGAWSARWVVGGLVVVVVVVAAAAWLI